jgi:hypothetical protein
MVVAKFSRMRTARRESQCVGLHPCMCCERCRRGQYTLAWRGYALCCDVTAGGHLAGCQLRAAPPIPSAALVAMRSDVMLQVVTWLPVMPCVTQSKCSTWCWCALLAL